MINLAEELSMYSSYHQDRRNQLTHYVGIPLIIFGLLLITSRLRIWLGTLELSLAMLICVAVMITWFRLDRMMAAVLLLVTLVLLLGADHLAVNQSFGAWLFWCLVTFVGGWGLQFLGHWYEGRHPAFIDNVLQLLIAPMYLVAELLFKFGVRQDLKRAIEHASLKIEDAAITPR